MSPDPEAPPPRRDRPTIAPLAPVALGLAAGIVADGYVAPWGSRTWGLLAFATALAALAAVRHGARRAIGPLLAASIAAVGGGLHHRQWSDLDPDDLARFDWGEPRPAWLRGVLVEVPEFRPGESSREAGVTRTELAVTASSDGRAWHRASGRVRLYAAGDRRDLAMGEPVEAAGTLATIPGPRNPGEADRRLAARARGVRLSMSIEGPEGLHVDPEGRSWPWSWWLGRLRAKAHERLVAGLPPDVAPLAAALLLGRREAVDPEVNDAFARTGTTHLLAISGLHMQALALLAGVVLTAAGAGRRASAGAVILLTIAYALLVGWAPSVVRAGTMTVVVGLAILADRGTWPSNLLAAAAVATLLAAPAMFFDVGAQLSFVCVMALVWAVPPLARGCGVAVAPGWVGSRAAGLGVPSATDRLDALERRYAGPGRRALLGAWDWLRVALIASAVVWVAALPLVMLRFHLMPFVGVALNVPLVLLAPLTLGLAASTLLWSLTGLATPGLLAGPTAWLLRLNRSVVGRAAAIPGGHRFVASPPLWWVLAAYGLLAVAMMASRAGWRRARWAWAAWLAWTAAGAAAVLIPTAPEVPEAEVLAVDHGLAVVVRTPGGRTLLYDCGKLRDPRVGRRVVAPALWALGARRVDAVILSHADADHYDGLPDVLDRFAVGEVLVPPGFGGGDDAGPADLLALCTARGVPVRRLSAGARLDLGGLTAEVLHPPDPWLPGAPDNDRSVVLDLACEGRHLLLTGDLEGAGLPELLARPPRRWDALLAPHHGGRSANPPWLYDWADPRLVLVSQRRPPDPEADALAPLEARGRPVLRTWESGALRVAWGPGGLSVRGFLGDEEEDHLRFEISNSSTLGSPDAPPPPPASPWLRALAGALGFALGLGACAALGVVEFGAWALVTAGRRHDPTRPDREPPPWEPMAVEAPDGVRLAGARRPAPGSGGRTLLLLHGFAEDRAALVGRGEAMAARGWDAVVIDSRGRGASGGDRTSFGGREADDLRAWVAAVSARAGPGATIAAWGRSMGAAIALRAAVDEPRLRAVVLEAPYPDLTPTVAAWLRRWRLPAFLAPWMLRRAARLAGVSLTAPRPLDLAPRLTIPALIVHGARDPVAPPSDARRLAGALGGPVEFVEVPGARHADVFDVGGPDLADRIAEFLDESADAGAGSRP